MKALRQLALGAALLVLATGGLAVGLVIGAVTLAIAYPLVGVPAVVLAIAYMVGRAIDEEL